jgi:KaiC/GvpD/RAD55 family RecA-like ATPase
METLVKIPEAINPMQTIDFLIAKPANQWIEEAKRRPIPRMLYKELWHEGELCILFASSGLGKSVLAVQIGNAISKDQTVLYFDFELSDKQFEHRYSEEFKNHFVWDEKFIRIELNPDADKPEKQTVEEYLINSIERCINETGAKILIIDNLTYLRCDTEKAKDALPLMKKLKELKKKYDLSILTLAHTPKRDASKAITKNDLSGSIMLINFCDSAFAIGVSALDSNVRYVKQIKERFTENIYGEDNVMVFQIEKPINFLQFTFLNYGKEIDYLRNVSEGEKQVIKEMVQQRHREGKSYREIAREFNISLWKVQKYLKREDEKATF